MSPSSSPISETHKKIYHEALADFRSNHMNEAIQKLRLLIAEAPTFEDVYEALSVILYHEKKYDDAIEIIRKWISLNPNSHMAQTNLSRCYVAKGMILEAEQAQAEARKLTWKEELKSKKLAMPEVNHDERIQRFKQVIDLDPADVLGYFSLGTAYLDAGLKRDAADTFEKALRVDPNHSSSYYGFGLALEGLGDIKKATKIYQDGMKVAEKQGDIMTLRKMESRLRSFESK